MKKLLPLGISDFEELISNNYYYVDKTLLIKDVFENGKVLLATRPRRFGKTLNLSMLRYFFEISEPKNDVLFFDTAIWKLPQYKSMQGQFPVIFVTFKGVMQATYEMMLEDFAYTIGREYDRLAYLLEGDFLEPHEKDLFIKFQRRESSHTDLSNSLEFLARMLHKYHKRKVVILLDEYDVPIQNAFINGFYEKIIPFVRKLLSEPLKDQAILEKGFVTGNLTLARAGIFTGLNNLTIHNILQSPLSDKFGFTSEEAQALLTYYDQEHISKDIQRWYNGYTFGDTKGIYNPWSMLNCMHFKGTLDMYWANTSDNVLLKRLIGRASYSTKSELELLLQDQTVSHEIVESITFPDIDKQLDLIWSILLFTGYLTYTKLEFTGGKKICQLIIPNQEIAYLYKDLINQIFREFVMGGQVVELLKAVTQGETIVFSNLLQSFIINSMSSFDIPDPEPERSYHLFVLGLLAALSGEYEVKSNKESGFGRYDIMLIPKNTHKSGVVIEFKKVWPDSKESIEEVAQKALDQIIEKKYIQELRNRGIQKIIAYGIGFERKNVYVKSLVFNEENH